MASRPCRSSSSPTAPIVPSDGPFRRYRVDARCLPFTPNWFWEVIDTRRGVVVENSLALSRGLYDSPADALRAGEAYLGAARKAA
jgi:hypothetical protein